MDVFNLDILMGMDVFDLFLKLGFGAIVGLCLGLTGVGGGVLIIPILQFVFGMEPVLAVGTASIIASLVKINAAFSHARAGNIAWKEVRFVLIGAIPTTLVIAHVIVTLSNNPEYSAVINSYVQYTIFLVMMVSLYSMAVKLRNVQSAQILMGSPTNYKAKGISGGAFCGLVMGSTGIGGGVLLLPVLNTVLGLNIKISIGSSIVIALMLSGVSAINYSIGGQSDVFTALLLVAGSFAGVPVAMRLVKFFEERHLYMITILIILVSIFLTSLKYFSI